MTGGDRTWPAALGLSFAAGSTEDSVPPFPNIGIAEGITTSMVGLGIQWGAVMSATSAALGLVFGKAASVPAGYSQGHEPKPIVLPAGLFSSPPLPQTLPVQLIRIGTVAIVGIPGEITTMAGRRLRSSMSATRSPPAASNTSPSARTRTSTSQYITTPEEYKSQQYEGASTLFGPQTLEAHMQVAAGLAQAMLKTPWTAPAETATVIYAQPTSSRWRIRNLSGSNVRLRFYNPSDSVRWITLPHGDKTIAAGREYVYPPQEFTEGNVSGGAVAPLLGYMGAVNKVSVWRDDGANWTMSPGQLLTIAANGAITVGEFTPPPRG